MFCHSEEPWQGGETGQQVPQEVQQREMPILHLGLTNTTHQYRLGKQLCREGPWGSGEHQAHHETAMCIFSTGGQQPLGLHWEKCCQQIKRGDPSPCSALVRHLECQVQFWAPWYKTDMDNTGESQVKDNEVSQGSGAPAIQEEAKSRARRREGSGKSYPCV